MTVAKPRERWGVDVDMIVAKPRERWGGGGLM